MTELKYSIESLNSRLGQAEEGITKFKDISFEIVHSEKKKKKGNEEYLQVLWDTIKKNNLHIIESEKKRGRKG